MELNSFFPKFYKFLCDFLHKQLTQYPVEFLKRFFQNPLYLKRKHLAVTITHCTGKLYECTWTESLLVREKSMKWTWWGIISAFAFIIFSQFALTLMCRFNLLVDRDPQKYMATHPGSRCHMSQPLHPFFKFFLKKIYERKPTTCVLTCAITRYSLPGISNPLSAHI